jgi:tetratricopeptide (TPR) repeat protein
MKKMKKYQHLNQALLLAMLLLLGASCSGILDEKPDKALIVPTTISELWALLDNNLQVMNSEPSQLDASSDDVLILDSRLAVLDEDSRRIYTWSNEPINNALNTDWSRPYDQVFYSNVVLGELEQFDNSEKSSQEWRNLKGAAHFYRAYAFFSLARSFCVGYDPATAGNELGIVLRLDSDIAVALPRSTLKETFEQIILDLEMAEPLVQSTISINTRPSKAAVWAMLSRVYLYMGDFEKSLEAADRALSLYDALLDYNQINPSPARPFVGNLDEVIFYSELLLRTYYFFSAGSAVSPELYAKYEQDDLRRSLFFFARSGFMAFRGQYSYLANAFGGLAVDELWLNKAECEARLGQSQNAINSLNTLLVKRFKTDKFIPIAELSGEELVEKVLEERRKELVLRGMRWGDIKRLNVLGGNISLTRTINGTEIRLPANDPRFALSIPQEEIDRSGIRQNPR